MSKVLTLRGVTTKDIQTVEQIMELKLDQTTKYVLNSNSSQSNIYVRNTYNVHPKYIIIDMANPISSQCDDLTETSNSIVSTCDWIKSTNIKCNTCLRTFNTMPLFMPTYIDVKSNKLEIGIDGNFCSYSCIITHIDIKFPNISCGANQSKYKQMVYHIYKIFTGKVVKHIEPSPPYTCMDEYGGNLTASEYYKKIDNMNQFNNISITNYTIKPSRDGLSIHEKIAGKSIKDILYVDKKNSIPNNQDYIMSGQPNT